jgi:DNA sulfur modification protein DndB
LARKSYSQIGLEFETEVRSFLQNLDFNDVKGGQNFRISGKQIDAAFGTLSKTYVIVSCTTRNKLTSDGAIENKINELKSWYLPILEGMKSIDSLKNYNSLRLVLAIKGIAPTERDKKLCASDPNVYLWDEQFFEYYKALQSKIGIYAKYELQRELEIKLDESEFSNFKSIPSLKITIERGNFYYLTAVDPLELLKITYVARRERGDQSFYQRMINQEKIKKIAFQIKKNHLSFYNNVILSSLSEEGLDFKELSSKENVSIGNLSVNSLLKSLWIVDGQHRLYGYSKVKNYSELNHPKIPLSIIVSKSEIDQGSLFISINTNQTILSEDYKWDLYGVYTWDAKRNVSALTPKSLNRLTNLKDKIYIPSLSPVRKKALIGISKIARTIYEQPKLFYGNLADNKPNPVYRQKDDDLKNAARLAVFIDDNLTLIGENDPWLLKFFKTSTGIQVFIILLLNHLLYNGETEENVKSYLRFLCEETKVNKRFDTDTKIKNIEKSLNSRDEKGKFIGQMIEWINERMKKTSSNVRLIPELTRKATSQEVEKIIRDFFKDRLSLESKDWFKESVPPDIKENLKSFLKDKTLDESWEYIDIGSLIKILEMAKNWDSVFKKVYLDSPISSFLDKQDVVYTFKTFKKLRDADSHGRNIEQTDRQMGEAAALKLKTFIEKFNENVPID